MQTTLTPEQRAAEHIPLMCPACGHEAPLSTNRYAREEVYIGRMLTCPWCDAQLQVAAIRLVVKVTEPTQETETAQESAA
jgi:transcription elongation factor Elf1